MFDSAPSANHPTPRLDTAGPVIVCACLPTVKGGCGCVQSIGPMPNAGGMARLVFQRELLAARAKRLRGLRQLKRACSTEAEVRRITHQIFATKGKTT